MVPLLRRLLSSRCWNLESKTLTFSGVRDSASPADEADALLPSSPRRKPTLRYAETSGLV